jgi:threonyl-tRNA synthetase
MTWLRQPAQPCQQQGELENFFHRENDFEFRNKSEGQTSDSLVFFYPKIGWKVFFGLKIDYHT